MYCFSTLLRHPNDSWASPHGGKKLAFLEGGSAHQRSGSYLGHSDWLPEFLHGSFSSPNYSTALTGCADHHQNPRSFHQGQVVPKQMFWCFYNCRKNEQIMQWAWYNYTDHIKRLCLPSGWLIIPQYMTNFHSDEKSKVFQWNCSKPLNPVVCDGLQCV